MMEFSENRDGYLEKLIFKMMELYSGDLSQIQHFLKVHAFARLIGLSEVLDDHSQHVLETAAVVHDVGIKAAMAKYGSAGGRYQELEGPPVAEKMLDELNCQRDIIERVCYLVAHHHTYTNIDGLDYQILVEADFLVNLAENGIGAETIRSTRDKIFRTKTGLRCCQALFNIK